MFPGVHTNTQDMPRIDQGRIDVSTFGGLVSSSHHYVTVDGVEVFRVLTEGDAARYNRAHPSGPRIKPGESHPAFDSEESAWSAGIAVLVDGSGYDEEHGCHLVHRVAGAWVPTGPVAKAI